MFINRDNQMNQLLGDGQEVKWWTKWRRSIEVKFIDNSRGIRVMLKFLKI